MEQITKALRELYDELHSLQDTMTANLRTIQARNNDIEQWYVNSDKKEVKVKEKHLWDEIQMIGMNSEAGRILLKKYPEVFEMEAKVLAKKKELEDYSLKELGFNPTAMNLVNLIDLINKIIKG
jgi:hypothetical protein